MMAWLDLLTQSPRQAQCPRLEGCLSAAGEDAQNPTSGLEAWAVKTAEAQDPHLQRPGNPRQRRQWAQKASPLQGQSWSL